ncbi:MAG: AarF/ABC1/UbiB kinase family protein [Pseudomonadota bacterium]
MANKVKFVLNFIFLLLAFHTSQTLADFNTPTPNELAAIEQVNRALDQTLEVLSNRSVPHALKSEQLTKLFETIGNLCVEHCPLIVTALEQFNRQLEAPPVAEVLQKGFPQGLPDDVTGIAQSFFKEFSGQASSFLKRPQDPEELAYRIRATVELVRAVIGIEEHQLFDLLTAEKSGEAVFAELMEDLQYLYQQMKAALEIYQIIKGKNGLNQLTPDETKILVDNVFRLNFFYVKLLQTGSNSLALFSPEQLPIIEVVQDQVPPTMGAEEVATIIREDLGADPAEIYEDFDFSKPFASGTVAQIYRAKLKTPKKQSVVIKVLRSGLPKVLEWNRKTNRALRALAKLFYISDLAPFMDLFMGEITHLEAVFEKDMDFPNEAWQTQRAADYFALDRSIKAPNVYFSRCGRRVITMEDLGGMKLDRQVNALVAVPSTPMWIDARAQLFDYLLGNFLYQVMVLREVHAELTPGNLLALPPSGPRVGIVDWSQVSSTRGLLWHPLKLLFAIDRGNASLLTNTLLEMGSLGTDKSALEFRLAVEDIFKKNDLQKSSLLQVLQGKYGLGAPLDKTAATLYDLFSLATGRFDYHLDVKYIQFIRTLAPFGQTFLTLGQNLPEDVRRNIIIKRLLLVYPMGIPQMLAGKLIRAYRWLSRGVLSCGPLFSKSE